MTTLCSDIVTRAMDLSVANAGVLDVTQSADVRSALVRIQQAQTQAFTALTAANKTAFLTSATVTSTASNGNRRADLSGLSSPVQRIVRVTLASGVEVALVDPNFPTSELAPRYITEGETVVEVTNDWDTATANAVALAIQYDSRPPDLDASGMGTLAQAVSIPDRYTDVLVYNFGAYLAEKDIGREDQEVADLLSKSDTALQAWITSASQFGGLPAYTFNIPVPSPATKD